MTKSSVECFDLEDIALPDGVAIIGESAFGAYYRLKNITIPENVTIVDELAFSSCLSLDTVIFKGVPKSFGCCIFHGSCPSIKIIIPKGALQSFSKVFPMNEIGCQIIECV